MEKENGNNKLEFGTDSTERLILDDRFKIIKSIGTGGMGDIFLAEDLKLRRQVAIKSIKQGTDTDHESKMRFLREAQTASQLEHTNICPIYEIYEEKNNHYIVMQYIDGVTLDAVIRYKELKIRKILDIGLQICEGMSEAHEKGIIHRDLKPGNVIINKKGIVKILDFGLAKFREGSDSMKTGIVNSNLTEKGIVMGTVAYMSPEQARGEILDNKSDIFSFGILLYELIEGTNPFYDKEQINTLYNVINKEVEFTEKFSPEISGLLSSLMRKKRSERLSDFKEVKDVLQNIQDNLKSDKVKNVENGATEIIDLSEKNEILEEIRKTSDIEDLGDLVYKIKKIKAKTIPIYSTKKNIFKKVSIFFTIALMLFSAFLFFKSKTNLSFSGDSDMFFINVQNIKGEVPDSVKRGVKYLIMESLNQFDEFDTVTQETVNSISRSDETARDPETVKNDNRIFYDLNGTISKIGNIYNFDIVISSNKGKKKYSMTIPGLDNRDSILVHQIDTLAKRIYFKLFPNNEGEIIFKPISAVYGTDWEKYESFFKGLSHFYKYEYMDAENCFKGEAETPASKYFLANMYYFMGKRDLARKKIMEIVPVLNDLTEQLKLKVLALKARMDFKFGDEINYLNELRKRNALSKTALYELGEAYFHHGDAEKASGFYKNALKLDNEFSSALNHLGYCNSYLGNHVKAIELFEEYRNLDNSANSFDSLGDGYFFSGDLVYSEASKKAAVKKDSMGVYWAYLTLSDIALLKARFSEVESTVNDYLNLTEEKKDIANANSKLAYMEYLKKNYMKGLEIINKSLSAFDSDNITNNSSEARWVRALINLSLKNISEFKKDLTWLEEIIKRNNVDMENFSRPYKFYLHLKALNFEFEGKTDKADEIFKQLLEMKTRLNYWITLYNYQYFHTEYAEFLFRNRNFEKSEYEIEKCLEYNKDHIPALWLKAELLEQKDKEKALEVFRKINFLYGKHKEKNIFTNKLRSKLDL
ncbi:MAG: protein kinase [Acidobacteriota bacterium]